MTHEKTESGIANVLTAICNPLAKKLGKMHRAIEGWTDCELQTALSILERLSPVAPEEKDFCEAEHIVRAALEAEQAKRTARNAPWLDAFVECKPGGRYVLTLGHHFDNALTREFDTFEEAHAAGGTIRDLLTLLGRSCDFSYQTRPCAKSEFSDDVPF